MKYEPDMFSTGVVRLTHISCKKLAMHTNSKQQWSQKTQIAKKFLKADIFYQTSKEPLHLIYITSACVNTSSSELRDGSC